MTVAAAASPEPIRLKPVAYEVFASPVRHRVWMAGGRSGKTFMAVAAVIDAAASRPKRSATYVAPTHDMARTMAWEALKDKVPPEWLAGTPRETDLEMTLKNGSRIRLRSGDRPDRLRGFPNDLIVFDESRDIDPYAWQVARVRLGDREGRALFVTTPNGYDWNHGLWLKGQEGEKRDPEWASWSTTTVEGGWVSAEETEKARRDMDERLFRQEFLATFEAMADLVYDNFSDKPWPVGNVDGGVRDNGSELIVGMDFNINPLTYVVLQKIVDQPHVLDAVELSVSSTEEACQDIQRRYPNRYIIVCPDPAGKQRRTSAAFGQTDFTILRAHGFRVDAPPGPPGVRDRINNTRANICAADGTRRLHVHPRATALRRALLSFGYKDQHPDKHSPFGHILDALGYALWRRFNLMQSRRLRTGRFTL